MKNLKSSLLLILLIAAQLYSKGQTIFTETFGQTTTRQTSPYVPSGGFIWGNPSGTNNEKAIENNHYAVIAPANIRDGYPVPFYWFWTGPEPTGNTNGSGNNPATNDHTGDVNGAVMVINAGTTLNDFYQRQVTLVPGNSYRLSVWFYLVNANSQFTMGVKDAATNTVLGSYTSSFLSTEDSWVQHSYDFTYPSSCPVNGSVKVFLGNAFSAAGGNDYYIDDILLETIGGPFTNISCPTSFLPIKLESFNASIIDNNNVRINWKTSEEYNVENFIVEKSIDGISFNTLKIIQPSNSATGNTYNVTDNNNYNSAKLFYRLKTVNTNGSISYSNIIQINLKSEYNDVNVYPQPSQNGTVYVSWKLAGLCDIELFDATGKKIKSWYKYNFNTLTIDGLTKGLYIISILQNGKELNKRIIAGQ